MGQDKGRAVRATIGLAAGGTGGHLFPAEALARELQARGHGVVLYTDSRGARFTQAREGLPHEVLPARSRAGGTGGHPFPAVAVAGGRHARGHGVVLYTERRGARFPQALEGLPHEVLPARSLAGGPAGKLAAAVVIARAATMARADMRRRGV